MEIVEKEFMCVLLGSDINTYSMHLKAAADSAELFMKNME